MNRTPSSNLHGHSSDHVDYRQDRHDDASDAGANPYYTAYQSSQAPDLDANAPQLKSSDAQRLNRKALFFLAGIIGLLVLMTALMLKSASSSDEAAVKPREETIVIPELPRGSATDANAKSVEPIELAATDLALDEHLPPLPQPDIAMLPPKPSDFALARQPTLTERRMNTPDATAPTSLASPEAYAQAMLAGLQASPAVSANAADPSGGDASSAQFLRNPDALLVRGTYIRCVLETRIITDVPGFTSCVVTEPVYSINGHRLLLPKGSKISGKYNSSDPNGPRISVIWDRITTPSGMDVSMASPGIDNLGGAGHPGDYNAHWASRMSAALMISLVSDAFKYAGAKHGPETSAISNGVVVETPFESNTARTVERLANHALDRSIHRPATVTINQGTIMNVYVAKDVDFSGVLARDR